MRSGGAKGATGGGESRMRSGPIRLGPVRAGGKAASPGSGGESRVRSDEGRVRSVKGSPPKPQGGSQRNYSLDALKLAGGSKLTSREQHNAEPLLPSLKLGVTGCKSSSLKMRNPREVAKSM